MIKRETIKRYKETIKVRLIVKQQLHCTTPDFITYLLPATAGHIHPAASGALLAAELERRADGAGGHGGGVGRWVHEMVVLAAALADQAREAAVAGDVVAHLLPEVLERAAGGRAWKGQRNQTCGEVEKRSLVLAFGNLINKTHEIGHLPTG